MKQCPACRRVYHDNAVFCFRDANRLSSTIVLDEKYRLEEKIGEGGMGEIYRATHLRLGTTWAIKILHLEFTTDPNLVERFRREAQAATRIKNRNVVEIIDTVESIENGLVYFVMEFLKGMNLKERLQEPPPLTYAEIYLILDQVCRIVHDAHCQGITHRDLKPDNIFLVKTKDLSKLVRVLDFGIAHFRDLFRLTDPGKLIGSPEYMSPEHCDDQPLDARSDVYTLGVDLYEMLTGDTPFPLSKYGYQTILTKHLYGYPERLREIRPEIPQPIEDVVMKALQKSRTHRQQTALQLIQEFEQALDISGIKVDTIGGSFIQQGHAHLLSRLSRTRKSNRLPQTLMEEEKPPVKGFALPATFLGIIPQQSEVPLRPFEFMTATLDAYGSEIQRSLRRTQCWVEDLGKGTQLEMVQIPPGMFMMGSTESDSEQPVHQVMVPMFSIGKFPVTQAQWQAVAQLPRVNRDLYSDPSKFKGGDLPVEQISWDDAIEFCTRLSQHTRKLYRLPTEAEWEYACRAMTTTPFSFGETISAQVVNFNASYPYKSGRKGTSRDRTTPVGSLKFANNFGLYDMHGNVLEWCLDAWHENYTGAPTDGSPRLSGSGLLYRVQRGGSWNHSGQNCRSAYRYGRLPDVRNSYLGFRVVVGKNF